MNLSQMIDAINRRVDDVVDKNDAVEWLNAGQNIMAQEVGASFPQLTITPTMDATFVFPEKYHEIPVLYAAAMYKAFDSSIREKESYMAQFIEGVKTFAKTYEVPPQYRDDPLSQQFIATAGQTTFTITKNSYNPRFGDLKVYINDQRHTDITVNDDNTFRINNKTLNDGDRVTAIWEEHAYLVEPPYNWWSW